MKKGILPKIFLIMIALLVFLCLMMNLIRREPPLEDSDLEPLRLNLTPEENAFDDFALIGSGFYQPKDIEGDTFCELLHSYESVDTVQ